MFSQYRTEIKWGVIFTVALLAWMLIERLVGLHSTHIAVHPIYTNIFAIIAITVYVLALQEKRDRDFAGKMNWAQGFITGIYITIVVVILNPLAQLIIHYVITPHFFTNAATHAVEMEQMSATDAAVYFSLSNYLVQSFVGAAIMGIITAAVVALFVRRK
ncbi:DUF4199 domain-containing protein [Aliidiomarina shirensis]|uniref:DUF4199 domain-containing protein n=1 Tax=Aliidiomarina shirensis TaxID=1048642 RepID=A0A432WSS3_9GAMM|nr:DUF4199 domain-containing protein [Aliidiomarina shirensis]RUO36820.1 DUF4199 domain-containing protein [Aliidiomarina shirensis]